jgi:hypothetical protein
LNGHKFSEGAAECNDASLDDNRTMGSLTALAICCQLIDFWSDSGLATITGWYFFKEFAILSDRIILMLSGALLNKKGPDS